MRLCDQVGRCLQPKARETCHASLPWLSAAPLPVCPARLLRPHLYLPARLPLRRYAEYRTNTTVSRCTMDDGEPGWQPQAGLMLDASSGPACPTRLPGSAACHGPGRAIALAQCSSTTPRALPDSCAAAAAAAALVFFHCSGTCGPEVQGCCGPLQRAAHHLPHHGELALSWRCLLFI